MTMAMNRAPIRFATSLLALALPLWSATAAKAASIPVPNFSFEEDMTMGDSTANASITGWKASGNPKFAFAGTYDPGDDAFNGTKGRSAAPKMEGFQVANLWTPCTLQSEESLATVQAGVTYTLRVAIGDPDYPKLEPGRLGVGFLIGDGTPAGGSDTFDGNDGTPEGTFDDYTFSYTATEADAGKTLKIFFSVLDENGAVDVDNFRLTTDN